jgi:hypothetical protein
VQFLESSVIGLRSAIHELASPQHRVRIFLFPMVHIADPSFYDEVRSRLNRCDALLVEGVRSFRSRLLTLAYRIPARRHSLGIALQSDKLRHQDLTAVIIHGDFDVDAFSTSWQKIPWVQRMALQLVAPIYGAAMYLFATRESLCRGHSVESLQGADLDSLPKFREAILDSRDRQLVQRIETYLGQNGQKELKLAILFGGGHMPAVASALASKHRYSSVHSEWVTAIAAGA